MKNMTFQEAYNKIVTAYYKDELEPLNSCRCFIGNLFDNSSKWHMIRTIRTIKSIHTSGFVKESKDKFFNVGMDFIRSKSNYTADEIIMMENNFIDVTYKSNKLDEYTEESLFNAMESTLEMLKSIHQAKGEIIMEYNFTKRELVK